jgi:hypothetical protein
MKRLSVAVLLALILAASFSAYAQTATPATPATAPAPSAAIDPAALAAAKELVIVLKMREMTVAMVEQAAKNLPLSMGQAISNRVNGNTKLSAEQKQAEIAIASAELPKMVAALQEFFADPKMIDEMVATSVPLYARHFTADEINQVAAFYKSPVGAKTLRLMPQLESESKQMGQQIVMPRLAKLMEKFSTK